ncbi:hypothetical protein GQ54DRAFT_295680, partial [Martensiomyces pterosporus]
MRPSTTGGDSSLDINTRSSPAVRPSEADEPQAAAAAAQDSSSAGGGGGNNTRSFRFLLTLALRKAQTAVTLDNGGHVEEAIRTYREAISMLGLVLSRTNEEDGRQRLLHFRQTYSDRVAVLSSLRQPPAGGDPLASSLAAANEPQAEKPATAEPASTHALNAPQPNNQPLPKTKIQGANQSSIPQQQQHEQQRSSGKYVATGDPNKLASSDRQTSTEPSPKQQATAVPASEADTSSSASSINEAHGEAGEPRQAGSEPIASHGEQKGDSGPVPALKLPPTTRRITPEEVTRLSPVILNKPLPPLANEEDQSRGRSPSVSSSRSEQSSRLVLRKRADESSSGAQAADQQQQQVTKIITNDRVRKLSKSIVGRTKRSTSINSEAAEEKPMRTTRKSSRQEELQQEASDAASEIADDAMAGGEAQKPKDVERVSRRQSVKNQRSLPAILGIGSRTKQESKAVPPVPQIPPIPQIAQADLAHQANVPNLGRRLLGALRSNSSSDQSAQSSSPPSNAPAAATASVNAGIVLAESPVEEPIEAVAGEKSSTSTGTSPSGNVGKAQERELPETPLQEDLPPPTPAKDVPSPTGLPLKSPTHMLTKEQKRQSGAASRLVGLFKRKPSIPDILPPHQAHKLTGESAGAVVSPPMQSPSTLHRLAKDRRLSSSASTPNLAEAIAAAAAASTDQPALAVFAATERGDIPPMPAPPTLRPTFSVGVQNPVSSDVSSDEDEDEDGYDEGISARKATGVSYSSPVSNSGMPSSGSGHLPSISEIPSRQQQQQQIRPALRIATRSNGEILTSGPEIIAIHGGMSMSGVSGSGGGATAGRKLSITAAASGSQSMLRGNTSSSTSHTAYGHPAYGRPTLLDVEEDQRLEMFEPSFGTYHTDIGPAPPKSSPLSSLWFINTLHKSMVTGGAHLTPSLFIPRRLWYQTGIRIVAIEAKLGVLAQLTQLFGSIGALLSLPDIDTLFASVAPRNENGKAEAVSWETDEDRAGYNREKDNLHKSCVALHHWLNSLEDALESNRRMLSKKLKFISPTASAISSSSLAAGAASTESLQASMTHLPSPGAVHDGNSMHVSNASSPSLVLSNGDLHGSSMGGAAPTSPLSPTVEHYEMRSSDVPGSMHMGSGG